MKKEKGKGKPLGTQGKQNKSKKPVKRNRYADQLGLAIIIILGIIIYSNSFENSFHFDDSFNIVDNEKIRDLSSVKELWDFNPTRFVAYYSFAINYHFGEYNVWGYHFVNLIIHLINACLVWLLTLTIFKTPS